MNSATLEILQHASVSTWAILFVMAAISVFLWAVLIRKGLANRRQRQAGEKWRAGLGRELTFPVLLGLANRLPDTPMGRVALSALGERREVPQSLTEGLADRRDRLVREAVERSVDLESAANERGMVFLAFSSATGPLIGLLGTVWGIMDSFFQIGKQGSANITVVAPGIAEALLATLAGLVVAIPASVGYNAFAGFNRDAETRLLAFASELLCLFQRSDTDILENTSLLAERRA